MDEATFLGYLVIAAGTLIGFVTMVMKFVQPINELRIVIQKLNDTIDSLKTDNEHQNTKIDKLKEKTDKLDHRVGKLETKMNIYHGDGGQS